MDILEFARGSLPLLFEGVVVTLKLTLVSILLGMALGLFLALGRISRNRPLHALSTFYVEFMRGTPLLVQIFMIYFGIGNWVNVDAYLAGILALSLNSAAYDAEIFRAGIQSIGRGQMEAARSLGLTYRQALRLVILPQAFRVVLPPLGNEFIALLKDSSLVSIIGIADLMRVGREISGRTLKPFETFTIVAFLYLALTLPLTTLVRFVERRLKTT